jgi:dephospho-CoA kinase
VKVFGLTGGIASGKSTVSRMLAERGIPMVDADLLAREVVQPGEPASLAIREAFGPGVFAEDGSLDRKALGAIVFADASRRAALNAIVHPAVSALAQRRFAEHAAAGAPLVGYEVPLLFENGLDAVFRPTVLVAVDEATQVARLMARDGSTEDEARQRIRAQWPLAKKLERATIVLWNDGPPERLEAKVEALAAELRAV